MLSPSRNDGVVASLLVRRLREQGYIELESQGYSMFPFIKHGDICKFVMFDRRSLMPGDVVLYVTAHGKLVGHRLIDVTDNPPYILAKGDTNAFTDPVVPTDAVLGRLTEIRRGRRVIVTHLGIARVWTLLILKVPLMSKSVRKWLHITLTWQHRWNRLRLSFRFSSREHS
jgi:signal peptidase I